MTKGPSRLRVTVAPATVALITGGAAVAAALFLPPLYQTALLAGWIVTLVTWVVVASLTK